VELEAARAQRLARGGLTSPRQQVVPRAARVPSSTSAGGWHGGDGGDEAELDLVPCSVNRGRIREDGARFVKTAPPPTTWRRKGSTGRPGQRAPASSTHPAPPQAAPRRAERRQSSPRAQPHPTAAPPRPPSSATARSWGADGAAAARSPGEGGKGGWRGKRPATG
jgi:hypothetical protein